jgi:hypothetical protein
MVDSWYSKNCFFTKRNTKLLLPTALSPNNTYTHTHAHTGTSDTAGDEDEGGTTRGAEEQKGAREQRRYVVV